MENKIIVLGAGGHAKVVVSTLIEAGIQIKGIFDDDQNKWNTHILSVPVEGPLSKINGLDISDAIIAIGNNATRKIIAERFRHLRWVTVIHPKAYVHSSVSLGQGTVVFAKAVVQPDSVIGEHCIINTGATLDHDCRVGNYGHLAPGVNLAGEVYLGTGVFCGIGTKIIGGMMIGNWATTGAGSVVVDNLPEYSLAFGVPAKVIRKISHDNGRD